MAPFSGEKGRTEGRSAPRRCALSELLDRVTADWLAQRFGRRTVDTGAILALIDRSDKGRSDKGRSDKGHASCVKAYDNSRLPLLTTEAVLAEVFYLAERDIRSVWRLLRSGAIQMSPIAHEAYRECGP